MVTRKAEDVLDCDPVDMTDGELAANIRGLVETLAGPLATEAAKRDLKTRVVIENFEQGGRGGSTKTIALDDLGLVFIRQEREL